MIVTGLRSLVERVETAPVDPPEGVDEDGGKE